MALRLLQVIVPTDHGEGLADELAERDYVISAWSSPIEAERILVSALVPTDKSESLGDWLTEKNEGVTDYRLMLSGVEATVPVYDPEEDGDSDDNPTSDDAASRISREELYQDVAGSSRLDGSYLVSVVLAALVAAIGLSRDDVVLIIGAMIIAPLLGPNVALALGACLGDLKLGLRAMRTLVLGLAAAFVATLPLTWLLELDASARQIASRTNADLGDVVVGLCAGAVGALAFTTGLPAVTVGVVVSVALLPPLVVASMLAGRGDWGAAGGAFLLVVLNLVCMNLAGVVTFRVQGVRPRNYAEAERASKATHWVIAGWAVQLAALVALILWLW